MDINYFLKLQPGFENLADADLSVFARMLNVAIYPARHTFTRKGEPGHTLYLIIDGAVTLNNGDTLTGDDAERSLRVGEWFGLLSLVENLPAFENCISSESVTVASFNRVEFDELFESAPPVGRHLLYMLAKQLARTLILQNNRLSALSRNTKK